MEEEELQHMQQAAQADAEQFAAEQAMEAQQEHEAEVQAIREAPAQIIGGLGVDFNAAMERAAQAMPQRAEVIEQLRGNEAIGPIAQEAMARQFITEAEAHEANRLFTIAEPAQRVYQAPAMTWAEHQERVRGVPAGRREGTYAQGDGLGWRGGNTGVRPFQRVADRVRANNAVHERRKKKRFRSMTFRYNKKTVIQFSTEYFEDHKSFLKMMYSGRLPIKGVTHAVIIKSLYSLNSKKKINILLKDISRKTYNKYVASYYKNIGR